MAVVSSSFVGSITGSAAANVAITGSFTIPLMKKVGYTPEQSGAIEAAASNGGQVMPPIMGTAAFVMSEFLGLSYIKIMIAAIIPALAVDIKASIAAMLRMIIPQEPMNAAAPSEIGVRDWSRS